MEMLRKYRVVVIVAGLMLLEAVLLLFMLPSGNTNTEAKAPDEKEISGKSDTSEVPLGSFKVANYSDAGAPIRVDFEVAAVIAGDDDTKKKFEEVAKSRKMAITEAVRTVVGQARPDEVREPGLEKIKKELKQAIGKIIGNDKAYLESILIPTFNPYDI